MTTVPVLMMAGHRLLGALLTEAKTALLEDDWPDAMDCLQEFWTRLEKHMQAEEDILFPTLAKLSPGLTDELSQRSREHAQITELTETLLARAGEHDRSGCEQVLNRLQAVLASHCTSDERFAYALSRDVSEGTVRELAGQLDTGPREAAEKSTTIVTGASAHRVH